MNEVVYFWSGWEPVIRILVVGTLTYIGIVLILRFTIKRTLASMTAFDFIITIAMGSAFGRILTAKSISLSEAITTFLLLVTLQYIFSHLSIRSNFFHKLITAEPVLLFYKGDYMERNIRKQNLRKEDILTAARKKNFKDMQEVEAVILETDASFSIIGERGGDTDSTYRDLI